MYMYTNRCKVCKIVVPKHGQHVYIHNVLLVGCSDCLVYLWVCMYVYVCSEVLQISF